MTRVRRRFGPFNGLLASGVGGAYNLPKICVDLRSSAFICGEVFAVAFSEYCTAACNLEPFLDCLVLTRKKLITKDLEQRPLL